MHKVETVSSWDCHKGSVKVFTWKGVNFYAGGSSRGLQIYHKSLVINLKTAMDYVFLESKSPMLKKLCDKYNDIHVLNIECPDYGAPSLGWTFWDDLVKVIETLPSKGITNVTICCVGGHGRTGTVLTILYGLTEGIDDDRPVKTMREKYCKEIIESDEQINYIKEVLGIEFKDKKRESFGIVVSGGDWVKEYEDKLNHKDWADEWKKDLKEKDPYFYGIGC